jgi:hypothetical protein
VLESFPDDLYEDYGSEPSEPPADGLVASASYKRNPSKAHW